MSLYETEKSLRPIFKRRKHPMSRYTSNSDDHLNPSEKGFTLIELSIVLVIIGLIVGGVLVGQDLIHAAGVRATISQIEKYNTAVNTFRAKYDCLPGDCANAAQFGFVPRGQYAGEGDGNGVIEGVSANGSGNNNGSYENIGETTVFWVDLSQAGLIDGSFTMASETVGVCSLTLVPHGPWCSGT